MKIQELIEESVRMAWENGVECDRVRLHPLTLRQLSMEFWQNSSIVFRSKITPAQTLQTSCGELDIISDITIVPGTVYLESTNWIRIYGRIT